MTIEEIRKKKKELGYTIKQMSKLSGVSIGTLQKILNGETKAPRYETLQAIEQVFIPSDNNFNENDSDKSNILREECSAYVSYKKQGSYTIADYYALPDEQRVELIDGVIYDMGAPSIVHQRIITYVASLVNHYITENKGSCMPLLSPVDVRLDEDDRTMVQPDFMIVCDSSKIRRWGIMGAPDFVIEIVSKGSIKRDYILKLGKYIGAGVKEFWLIDPIEKKLLIYYADDDKHPYIGELKGKKGIGIYNDDLMIDLDEIAGLIIDYPE